MKKLDNKVIFNIISAFILIIILVYISLRFAPEIIKLVKSPQEFRQLLLSYKYYSAFVFIFFQIIQVIIAVIPGELVQIAGGYVYGGLFGTLYSLIGILLGSLIAFFISRIFGYSLVKKLVPKKSLDKLDYLFNTRRINTAILILFLIPGIPKDVLTYVAGLTPINTIHFLVISTIGRLPGILLSSFAGAGIEEKNYIQVIIVSIAAFVMIVIGTIYKGKLKNFSDKK